MTSLIRLIGRHRLTEGTTLVHYHYDNLVENSFKWSVISYTTTTDSISGQISGHLKYMPGWIGVVENITREILKLCWILLVSDTQNVRFSVPL